MKTVDRLRAFIYYTVNDNRVILIRIIVGLVFLTEGIQKLLFPATLGTGRFEKIGFTNPAFWAGFTAAFEISCGALVLIGLIIRFATIPLLIVMITAFITTKWPLLVTKGFWVFAHEYRTDFAMTLLLIFILIYGAGNFSADSKLFKRLE
jgi:putative oxidoreductase